MLYRIHYHRDGHARAITIAWDSLEGAYQFAERWIKNLRRYYRDIQLDTVVRTYNNRNKTCPLSQGDFWR